VLEKRGWIEENSLQGKEKEKTMRLRQDWESENGGLRECRAGEQVIRAWKRVRRGKRG